MKVSPFQANFSTGEVTPLAHARIDIERYRAGLEHCLRYIPPIQGGLTRLPGTRFVAEVKDSTKKARLLKFKFSTTQAYILEFGDQYVRFFKDNGQIIDGASDPYEVTTPYLEADLPRLRINQSNDVLYITHTSYPPAKLIRLDHDNWFYDVISFVSEPMLPVPPNQTIRNLIYESTGTYLESAQFNVSGTNVFAGPGGAVHLKSANLKGIRSGERLVVANTADAAPAAGTWVVRLIDAGAPGIPAEVELIGSNAAGLGGSPIVSVMLANFAATDVDRKIDFSADGGVTVRSGTITAFTSATRVVVAWEGSAPTDADTGYFWRMSLWSGTTGYPAVSVFHEQRLCFAGTPSAPQRIDMSATADFENFSITEVSGVVTASSAVSITLDSNDTNVIRWLSSDEKGLFAGTSGGEWVIRPSTLGEALSATNVSAKESTNHGSADIDAVKAGKATLFAQTAKRKLREFSYNYESDGFKGPDLSALGEHITSSGMVELAYTKEPFSIIWAVLNDGRLVGMTYERDLEALVAGWHRHIFGGVSDASGTHAKVESVAVIPSTDGTRDEVWLIVQRWINGGVKRYVEYIERFFDADTKPQDAFFVDSGLTYDNPLTVSGITLSGSVQFTVNAHGLSNGDSILISDLKGASELNGQNHTIENVTTNTFVLVDVDPSDVSAYVSGGFVRKRVTTISGLSHLEGEQVDVCADGGDGGTFTVSSGAITLAAPAAVVHAGLNYKSRGKLLRIEAGAADGVALGKTRRIERVTFYMFRTLGLKIGTSFERLDEIIFRSPNMPIDSAPSLYSGLYEAGLDSDYDTENQLCWQQDRPLPGTMLAVLPQMTTYDKG